METVTVPSGPPPLIDPAVIAKSPLRYLRALPVAWAMQPKRIGRWRVLRRACVQIRPAAMMIAAHTSVAVLSGAWFALSWDAS